MRDLQKLRTALSELAGVDGSGRGVFGDPKLAIHFARMALIEEPADSKYASWLLFESNFDTSQLKPGDACREHLHALAKQGHPALCTVLGHCDGYALDASVDELANCLVSSGVEATASYIGHIHRDIARIRLEQHLREVVLCYLETAPSKEPHALFNDIARHVRAQCRHDPKLEGLDLDAPAPPTPAAALRTERLSAGLMPWFAHAAPALNLIAFLKRIWTWQSQDSIFDLRGEQERWTDAHRKLFSDIASTEDRGIQNALTHVVPLRGGKGRIDVLRFAHQYVDRMARRHFNDIGQLGGIPTIHFAKWLLIDEGRRLLFFSNYDSSWESYLGDFVDQAAIGLNLAWACTENYPRTTFLAFGGANDEERFKAWGRACQRPTQLFYSAYPELSVASINNNTWIRAGLHKPGPSDIDAWFRRLT